VAEAPVEEKLDSATETDSDSENPAEDSAESEETGEPKTES
jgi:hypothetical protein